MGPTREPSTGDFKFFVTFTSDFFRAEHQTGLEGPISIVIGLDLGGSRVNQNDGLFRPFATLNRLERNRKKN